MGLEMRGQKTEPNQTFVTNGYLVWIPADSQMNRGGSSVHVQWFSHQNNGADYCDIIK